MKKVILLFLILLLSVILYGRIQDPCDMEGTKLLYYKSNEKIINLYDRTILTIGEDAFCNKRAEELILPKYVLYFEKYSISRNNKLKVLNLPPFVQYIEDNAFWGNAFEEINVLKPNFKDIKEKNQYYLGLAKALKFVKKSYVFSIENEEAENPEIDLGLFSDKLYDLVKHKYQSIEGVLYTFSGAKLVAYPTQKKDKVYIIPNGTLEIADGAFYNCTNLQMIFVPKTVVKIGENAFDGNKDLVLHISKNSQIHKYCLENKIKFELDEGIN